MRCNINDVNVTFITFCVFVFVLFLIQVYVVSHSVHVCKQGSHTSHMRKFKGILRVVKGSTAHFQGYF